MAKKKYGVRYHAVKNGFRSGLEETISNQLTEKQIDFQQLDISELQKTKYSLTEQLKELHEKINNIYFLFIISKNKTTIKFSSFLVVKLTIIITKAVSQNKKTAKYK